MTNTQRAGRICAGAAAGLLALTGLSATAAADWGWSTEYGDGHGLGVVGNATVVTFGGATDTLGTSTPTSGAAFFVDASVDDWANGRPGSFNGVWFEYGDSDVHCAELGVDGYYNETSAWGYVTITFPDGPSPHAGTDGGEYAPRFQATLTQCGDGPVRASFIAEPY